MSSIIFLVMMTGPCPTAGNELFWEAGVGGGRKEKEHERKEVIQSCADLQICGDGLP